MNFEDSMQCLLQKDPVVEFKAFNCKEIKEEHCIY